ncbi:hypothetical protein EV363DRAFT_958110 [Boletus edulis]|uniref:Uncharacterized protein n=1 Tax=Boletus edulis BED1 TaxID=1328754 RepID=A0AAD4BBJ5_BOLED|nr:hypothetical protein EV363DRAFT_958110 [Boletus edulis]KAF8415817.1 hypothetical protein L210DRAFT_3767969 [Boletus edulis BED1]
MPPHIPKDAFALLAKMPAIPVRGEDLYRRLKVLLNRSPRAKPLSILKYTIYIVFLLNAGSWPFVWHIRVFWPIYVAKLSYWILRFKLVFASKKERTHTLITWAENLSPVGANPFELTTVYKRWATIDDIDVFGMHLSNSSYAKALDSARSKAALKYFPAWSRSGGQLALGATHYYFLREIPPLVRFEVRLTIGSWDHKWLYVVARYVTQPSRRRATHRTPHSSTPSTPNDTPAQNGSAKDVEQAVAAIVQDNNGTGRTRGVPVVESDGAILHCVAVSQICFKWDRLTVLPAIVLASEGFTKPHGDGDHVDSATTGTSVRSYSHTNPPPNWIKSQSLRVPPYGSMDNFRAFLRGKWREVPEGERWWEDALGGSIETRRQANLEIVESLKVCMERTATLLGKR